MKKWIWAGAIALLAAIYHPFPASDPGEFCLVETLLVEKSGEELRLMSGDLQGSGESFSAAVENMEETAPGSLFLRQTKRIIFCGGAETALELAELPEELPMGAIVYRSEDSAETLLEDETLSAVLEAREKREKDLPTLANLENGLIRGDVAELGQKAGSGG